MTPPVLKISFLTWSMLVFVSLHVHAQNAPPSKPPAPEEPGPLSVTVTMIDKVRVVGELIENETLTFKFNFGEQKLPVNLIRSIRLDSNTGLAAIQFINGDRLSGKLGFDHLKLKTQFGVLLLPQAEIVSLRSNEKSALGAGPREGLVLHLTLDGDAIDHSDNPKQGLQVTGLSYVTTASGQAGKFNGSSSQINITSRKSVQITANQTISMWLKPTNFAHRSNPLHKAWGGEGSWTLETSGIMNYYFGTTGLDSGSYFTLKKNQPLTAGRWVHLTLVRDLKQRKLRWYVNGKLDIEMPTKFSRATAGNMPLRIGGGFAGYFSGLIKDVRIYNRALPKSDVLDIVELHRSLLEK